MSKLSPLPQRKSFGTIKSQGQVHGKLMARPAGMSREYFGFLTCLNAMKWGHGAKSSGYNLNGG
ncbi:hypothetical protein [Bradyrhizobium neotropicale]|uniref:hypothetical protein n=1 Tax=Bradyrhizobium neotropicale TaxID=1497615 RepID=UPI0011AB887C|nr:hypothetical protein [Bradyrhizobium neotropicale]